MGSRFGRQHNHGSRMMAVAAALYSSVGHGGAPITSDHGSFAVARKPCGRPRSRSTWSRDLRCGYRFARTDKPMAIARRFLRAAVRLLFSAEAIDLAPQFTGRWGGRAPARPLPVLAAGAVCQQAGPPAAARSDPPAGASLGLLAGDRDRRRDSPQPMISSSVGKMRADGGGGSGVYRPDSAAGPPAIWRASAAAGGIADLAGAFSLVRCSASWLGVSRCRAIDAARVWRSCWSSPVEVLLT